MKPIRVLIAEDQGMVLGALSALLELQGGFEVVAQVPDGEAAQTELTRRDVDLVLTDIEMPGMTGLDLAAWIRQQPEPRPKVVILTTFARQGYLSRARELGVDGYLLKEAPSDDLARALKRVMRGQAVYDPALEGAIETDSGPLNDRERRILRLAEEGLTTAEIAAKVFRSEGTVRNTLSDVIKRLGARNRTEATRQARERGWL